MGERSRRVCHPGGGGRGAATTQTRPLINHIDTTNPEQLAAAAEIVNIGSTFEIDRNSPGKPVVTVEHRNPKVTDYNLKHLEKLTGRRSLTHGYITDAGMEHLRDLT